MNKMERLLRMYVRTLLREKPEILGEPDFPDEEEEEALRKDKEQEEASGASAVAGVITPLGTGPNYPDDSPRRRSPAAAAGSAFGGAKPYRPPKKNKKN